jgi:prepilin-type N-terminal cleavage/methylation domain-containing protein
MKSKGFTLLELIIIVAIFGIIAAIAIPKFYESTDGKSKLDEFIQRNHYNESDVAAFVNNSNFTRQELVESPAVQKAFEKFIKGQYVPQKTESH